MGANAMIQKVTKPMAAGPQPFQEPSLEPVNALDLQNKMGISLETFSRAIHADPQQLRDNPRSQNWQTQLRIMADVWTNLLILFGNETHAKEFLKRRRPEFKNRTAIEYFDDGRPKVVLNLLCSMREMLP